MNIVHPILSALNIKPNIISVLNTIKINRVTVKICIYMHMHVSLYV